MEGPGTEMQTTADLDRCRMLAGPPLKLSERVVRLTSLTTADVEQLLLSLNLGVQKGLDPDPENLVAVGTFNHGSLPSPMQVGPLIHTRGCHRTGPC